MKNAVPLIITAMPQEAQPFINSAKSVEESLNRFCPLYKCSTPNLDFSLAVCGIGLVNAASTTTFLAESLNPSMIISAGTCGGIGSEVQVGDVIIGNSYRYYQVDVTPLGLKPGQVPGFPAAFTPNNELLRLAESAANNLDAEDSPTVKLGEIISGDEFVSGERAQELLQTFTGAVAVDMESTAIAHVADRMRVPFLSVRAVSDLCGESADEDFKASLGNIPARSTQIVTEILSNLPVN